MTIPTIIKEQMFIKLSQQSSNKTIKIKVFCGKIVLVFSYCIEKKYVSTYYTELTIYHFCYHF